MEAPSEDQVCFHDRIGEIAGGKGIEWKRSASLEGNDQHLAAVPRRDGDRPGTDAADPGKAASLNRLQRFVIVNVLRALAQVDDDLGISVRQEAVQVVGRMESLRIDQILDEVAQRKNRLISANYHLSRYII